MSESYRLTDDRLAWLAAKPYCAAQAAKLPPLFWLSVVLSVGRAASVHRRSQGDRMSDYAMAVDGLVSRLSAPERVALRSTNQLPPWFLPAVDERYGQLRRRRADD